MKNQYKRLRKEKGDISISSETSSTSDKTDNEEKSSVSSESQPSAAENIFANNYSPKKNVKENIHKVIEFFGNNPQLIGSAFAAYQNKNLRILAQINGIGGELLSLSGSYISGGIENLLRNGLLEEVLNMDNKTLDILLDQIRKNPEIIKFLGEMGVNEDLLAMGSDAASEAFSFLKNIKQREENLIAILSSQLADLVKNDAKINKLINKEKSILSQIVGTSDNKEKLKQKILIQNQLIKDIANTFISSFMQLEPNNKLSLLPIIHKIALGVDRSIPNENVPLEKSKESITTENNSQKPKDAKLNIQEILEKYKASSNIKKGQSIKSVVEDLSPLLKEVLFSDKLKDIVASGIDYGLAKKYEYENLNILFDNLMRQSLEFASDKKILASLMNEEILNLSDKFEKSSNEKNSKLPEELFYPELVANLYSSTGLKKIIPTILEMDELKNFLELEDSYIEVLKAIAPSLIDYSEPLVKNVLSNKNRMDLLIANSKKFFAEEQNEFIQNITNIATSEELSNTIFSQGHISKIIEETLSSSFIKDTLELSEQSKGEMLANVPELLKYSKNIYFETFKSNELIENIARGYSNYSKDKTKENLDSLTLEGFRLLCGDNVKSALLNQESLTNLATNILNIEEIKKKTKLPEDAIKFLPNFIPEVKEIAEGFLLSPEKLNSLYKSYQKFKVFEENSLISDAIDFTKETGALNKIFKSKKLDEFANILVSSPVLKNIIPEAKNYLQNVVEICLKDKQGIAALVESVRTIQKDSKIENSKFIQNITNIATSEELSNNIFSQDHISKIIEKTLSSSFIKDTLELSEQSKGKMLANVPELLKYSKNIYFEAFKSNELIENIARGYLNYSKDKTKENLDSLTLEGFRLLCGDNVKSALLNQESLTNLATKILNIEEFKKKTKLPEDAIKFLPNFIPEVKEIAEGFLSSPEKLNSLYKSYQKFKVSEENSLISDVIDFTKETGVLNKIFKSKKLDEFANILVSSPELKNIIPEAKNYLQNVVETCLKDKQGITALVESVRTIQKDSKIENYNNFYSQVDKFVNNPEIIDSLLNPTLLPPLLEKAEISIFKKDLNILKGALIKTLPEVIQAVKEGHKELFDDKEFKNIAVKGQALLASLDINSLKESGSLKKEATKLASEAIDMFSKKQDLQNKLGKAITVKKEVFAEIINKSLSSIDKDKAPWWLKLLKPSGIDGDFMVSMTERINNENSLKALKNLIEEPTVMNGLRLISTAESAGFIAKHVLKSLICYPVTKMSGLFNRVKPNEIQQETENNRGKWTNSISNSQQSTSRALT